MKDVDSGGGVEYSLSHYQDFLNTQNHTFYFRGLFVSPKAHFKGDTVTK